MRVFYFFSRNISQPSEVVQSLRGQEAEYCRSVLLLTPASIWLPWLLSILLTPLFLEIFQLLTPFNV